MSATKILWGQVLVVSLIVFAAIWAATQWTAWRLGYQPQLGEPWLQFASLRLYPPPAFFLWWFWFDAYAPKIFVEGAAIASSGGFAAIAIAIGMSVWRAHEAKEAVTYGSARWASAREVQSAGLLGADGVVLGRFGRSYLRHDGPEHVLCFAPTRSGKGVGLVVPTLLTWPGAAIVHDIKGENWRLTAGWRARFGRVLLFDPTNPNSSAYNPLLEVRRGNAEVRDVAERRRHPGRSGRSARTAKPLGEDQPLAAGRRDPARSLCRSRQDAGRSCELPVRSAPPDRDDPAGDDDDGASQIIRPPPIRPHSPSTSPCKSPPCSGSCGRNGDCTARFR